MAYQDIYVLRQSAVLLQKATVAVSNAARDILNESPATPGHNGRYRWAQNALINAEPVAQQMMWAILSNTTIQASGEGSTDNDIQLVVNSFVDLFALA